MDIKFECYTTSKEIYINIAEFHLADGTVITIDRDSTNTEIDNHKATITWENCYLWALNGRNIFEDNTYIDDDYNISEFKELVKNAYVELIKEDDFPSDYILEVQKFEIE